MEFLGHFLGSAGACHGSVLAMSRPLCPETIMYNFMSTMSRHDVSLQRHVAALASGNNSEACFCIFWRCFSLGLVLFGFRTLNRALRTPLRL